MDEGFNTVISGGNAPSATVLSRTSARPTQIFSSSNPGCILGMLGGLTPIRPPSLNAQERFAKANGGREAAAPTIGSLGALLLADKIMSTQADCLITMAATTQR